MSLGSTLRILPNDITPSLYEYAQVLFESALSAPWIIDLGPDGGKHGGQLMYQGPLAGITEVEASATGRFLKPHLEKR